VLNIVSLGGIGGGVFLTIGCKAQFIHPSYPPMRTIAFCPKRGWSPPARLVSESGMRNSLMINSTPFCLKALYRVVAAVLSNFGRWIKILPFAVAPSLAPVIVISLRAGRPVQLRSDARP